MRTLLRLIVVVMCFGLVISCKEKQKSTMALVQQNTKKPNIIFIMVDDLGYGDLGCYGQKEIKTPNIDALSKNGMLFTNAYAGSPVCAPSRSVLMTGKHTGHTTVRGNRGIGGVVGLGGAEGRISLKSTDVTVAKVLKDAGYITGMTGKWGLGEPNTSGLPNDHGFDEWFGFLNQRRAHHHYTDYLWKNKKKPIIPAKDKLKPEQYTHTLFTNFSLDFISKHAKKENPFFLYVPYLLPHAEYEIPEIHPDYINKEWTKNEKVHASMVSLIDSGLGKIVKQLKDLNIDKNTLLIFTSDNGASLRWDGRFDSSGALRGKKRDVYEGGIRVPMIASMPGTISKNVVNKTVWSFIDVLPTFADFARTKYPKDVDGKSIKNVLVDNTLNNEDRVLYWEFHEQGGKQAIRKGKWKAVRLDVDEKGFHKGLELYDLSIDETEQNNIASTHKDIVDEMIMLMEKEHIKSEAFPFTQEQ